MRKIENLPVIVVTSLLLLYCILISTQSLLNLAYAIFIASPILIIWMTFVVIRHGKYQGKELNEDEEWGYGDREKDANQA